MKVGDNITRLSFHPLNSSQLVASGKKCLKMWKLVEGTLKDTSILSKKDLQVYSLFLLKNHSFIWRILMIMCGLEPTPISLKTLSLLLLFLIKILLFLQVCIWLYSVNWDTLTNAHEGTLLVVAAETGELQVFQQDGELIKSYNSPFPDQSAVSFLRPAPNIQVRTYHLLV